MTLERLRKAAFIAGSTIALAAVVFATAQVGFALIVQKSYRDFAARTRDLEVYAAVAALEEHFSTVYDHADMVSGYSFPEYFKGNRTEESMRRLLGETRSRIPGCAAIVYQGDYGLRVIVSDSRASVMSMLDTREAPRILLIALIASLLAAAASLGGRLVRSEIRRRALDETKRSLSEAVRSRDFELVESEIRF